MSADATTSTAPNQKPADTARNLSLLAAAAEELIGIPHGDVDEAVRKALSTIGRLFEAKRVAILLPDQTGKRLETAWEWGAEGTVRDAEEPAVKEMPEHDGPLCAVEVASMADTPFRRRLLERGTGRIALITLKNQEAGKGTIIIETGSDTPDIDEEQRQVALITARMVAGAIERSESASRQRKIAHRLESAIKTGGIGTWELDLGKGRFSWDGTMYRIYGQTPESFSGRYDDWVGLLHPEDREWAVEERGETGNVVPDHVKVFRIVRPSGEIRYIKASTSIYKDSRGRATRLIGTNMDVTEEKQAELRLEHERDILSAGPVFTIEWSNEKNWPVTFVSDNVRHSLGYTPEEMKSAEFRYAELIHPDDLRRIVTEVGENMEKGTDLFEQSYRIKCKGGEYRWFFDFTQFRREPATGLVTAIQGYMYDQSAHKRTELERDQQQDRLMQVLEGTRAGTWQWDIQTGQTWFNEHWAEMIGYSLEELGELSIDTWMRFAHPDDLEESGRLLQEHFSGEKPYYEFESRMRHKDGHWIWVLDRGKVSRWSEDGQPILMSGTHQDITDRKRMEETALQKSKELEALYEGIQDGIVIADIATKRILHCNHVAEEMTGRDRTVLESLTVEILHPKEVLEETLKGFELQAKGMLKTIESEILHTSGKRIPVSIMTSRVVYKENPCLMGIFRDISESRADRIKIEASNQQLQAANQQLQASEQQLMAANQQLQASEQQLMAANQQLQASQQQLEATSSELREKQELQELMTGISIKLMNTDSKRTVRSVQEALARIGAHINAGNLTLFERSSEEEALEPTLYWHEKSLHDGLAHHGKIPLSPLPSWIGENLPTGPVFLDRIGSMPAQVQDEIRRCFPMKGDSLLLLPMTDGGRLAGILCVEWLLRPAINTVHFPLLHLAGELLFGALNRHRWAEEITQREEQYRSIFENIQDVYMEIELKKKTITEITPSVIQFGYRREEVLHTDSMQYYLDHAEIKQLYRTLLRQRGITDYELHLRKRNGEACTVSFSGEIMPPSGVRSARAAGTIRDITQRKRHEAQIQENIRLKNDFISMVSHELRTPLFSILGFSSMLLKEVDRPRTETHKEFLSIIHDESTRLSTLIEDVLTISRIDAGKDKYQPKALDPAHAVAEVMKTLQRSAATAKLTMTSEPPERMFMVVFDENALKQVLMNLISNAIKFTPAGGSVTIRLKEGEGHGIIEVEDTGIGIPKKDIEKVFEKFYRCEQSAIQAKGTGLGLAIVKDILAFQGGAVSVTSRLGKGSAFRIALPLEASATHAGQAMETA